MRNATRKPVHKTPRNTTTSTHKYPVGACVFHQADIPGVEGAIFRITRLLPDGGEGLQYRLKDERDGHERVSSESRLHPVYNA